MTQNGEAEQGPALSIVVPCYNEEKCLDLTIPPLVRVFREAGINVEVILVDNGSTDGTSAVIDRLISSGLPIVKGSVPVNRGVGLGVRTGYRMSKGDYVGCVCADGQVAPESVLLLFRSLSVAGKNTMAKVRRRFRQDSWARKIISIGYNGLMLTIFPGMPSLDVNGNPKLLPRDVIQLMDLTSMDWFLDAEIMLKAQYLKMMVIEIDVPGYLRKGGRSNVRLSTILEFVRNILMYRFGSPWRRWRKQVSDVAAREVHVL
jgi:glycosyltransferase involved in cell wall biosynthesis